MPSIVGEASRREHHPDNASACWMGGLTVARMSGEAEAQIARIRPKGKWPLLLAVPPDALSTEEARGVLPPQYSGRMRSRTFRTRCCCWRRLRRASRELLTAALEDRIHQPYRARAVSAAAGAAGVHRNTGDSGMALSGAGPSVLIFLDPAQPERRPKKSPPKWRRISREKLVGRTPAHHHGRERRSREPHTIETSARAANHQDFSASG